MNEGADHGHEQDDAAQALVDVTLIDEMLRLTPEERLRLNDRMVRTIEELRDAFAAANRPDDAPR